MRYQNLFSFQKHLASAAPHHLCRLYLIAVPDDYERNGVIQSVLSYLLNPDLLPYRCSGAEFSFRDFFDALQSQPLFGGESIVILDEAEKIGKKQIQPLLDFLSKPIEFGHVVIGLRGKASALSSIVEKNGIILDLAEEKPWDKEKRLSEQLIQKAKNAGKKMSSDALQLLFDRLEKDAALLESEIDKLICYVGERSLITRDDVLQIGSANRTATTWQTAEEIVWERGAIPFLDAATFHALLPTLRNQLQLGLTLATLIEEKRPSSTWNTYLPKIWAKTLEKRSSQAASLGSAYFQKGLEKLFEIELLSRSSSTQYSALLDSFRCKLASYAR